MASYKGCEGVVKVGNELGTGTGYLTSAAFVINDTAITVDTGTGTILAGNIITFDGDTNKYVVDIALTGDTVTIASPGLVQNLADDAAITVEGGATNVVSEVRDWNLTQTTEILDGSAMGSCDKVKKAGMKDATGSITCLWDDTNTEGQGAITNGAIVTLNLYPKGATSGSLFADFQALITTEGDSASYDGLVEKTFDFEVTGGVVWSTVA